MQIRASRTAGRTRASRTSRPKREAGAKGGAGPPGPPGQPELTYGFAYSPSSQAGSGTVPLTIAGPLHDVNIIPAQGLQVLRDGIYMISYQVTPEPNANLIAQFQVFINDTIPVPSSVTRSIDGSTVSASSLFSLLARDIVRLDAALSANASFRMINLQVVQIE